MINKVIIVPMNENVKLESDKDLFSRNSLNLPELW